MDKKSFAGILRKIIREEVTKAVRTEMRALLNETKTNHSKTIEHGLSLHEMMDEPAPAPRRKAPKRQYSKDSMLNDLLNETGPLRENTSWNSMNFNSQMAQGFAAPMSQATVAPPVDLDGRPVNTSNEKVATVVNAMTKDYSALMKAIDKKKGK
mgnify:FL=1|jgi:hypothetical protein